MLAFILIASSCFNAVAQNVASMNASKTATAIINATNTFRGTNQLAKLTTSKQLTETARDFAQFMAKTDKYGHEADGRTPGERAKAHGYQYCVVLENIAWQYRSTGYGTTELADKLTNAWKESPRHRKQMLDVDITETGVAVVEGPKPGKYYGVQLFGRPASARILFKVTNRTAAATSYRLISASGETEYQLEPRFGRTHKLCRVTKIVLPTAERPRPIEPHQWLILTEADGKTTLTIESLAPE